MNLKKFSFIEKLENNYDSNPSYCYHCGKPLTFKKFYQQFNNSKKYCSKKCSNNQSLEEKREFASETEKIIYIYLSLSFPQYRLEHNIIDLLPPYEIDMCLYTDNFPIYIEYNSSLHMINEKSNKLKKTTEKYKINDVIKKEEICNKRQQKMVRLWSKNGLYSRPDIFGRCLEILYNEIIYLINSNNNYGQCLEIIVSPIDNEIEKYNLKYKKED